MREEIALGPQGKDGLFLAVVVDPFSKHNATTADILAACGLIPQWLWGYENSVPEMVLSLKEYLEESYGFGDLHEMTGGVVEADGSYNYPEDPIMYPLIRCDLKGGAQFIQYSHGMVAFRQDDTAPWFVTRMD